MRLLLALLLTGCMATPSGLLDGLLLSDTHNANGMLSITVANDVDQAASNIPFGVPFENVPTDECRLAVLVPQRLSIPGKQGDLMTGELQPGECTILAAFWGNPRWQCYITFNDTPGGIVSKMTQGQQTQCSYTNNTYTNNTFHYAWSNQ